MIGSIPIIQAITIVQGVPDLVSRHLDNIDAARNYRTMLEQSEVPASDPVWAGLREIDRANNGSAVQVAMIVQDAAACLREAVVRRLIRPTDVDSWWQRTAGLSGWPILVAAAVVAVAIAVLGTLGAVEFLGRKVEEEEKTRRTELLIREFGPQVLDAENRASVIDIIHGPGGGSSGGGILGPVAGVLSGGALLLVAGIAGLVFLRERRAS